jgi:hypothetical protein
VLTVLAVSAVWREVPAWMTWALAASLTALLLSGWWVMHSSVAAASALQAPVERLRARLEQFSVAQGRFVDNCAHVIKTPLTIVCNRAELLRRCPWWAWRSPGTSRNTMAGRSCCATIRREPANSKSRCRATGSIARLQRLPTNLPRHRHSLDSRTGRAAAKGHSP